MKRFLLGKVPRPLFFAPARFAVQPANKGEDAVDYGEDEGHREKNEKAYEDSFKHGRFLWWTRNIVVAGLQFNG